MPGKVPPSDLISQVFTRTGEPDRTLIQGPADGEDAAAIDPPDGTLVVSSDPISLAAANVGTFGVHIACNDVAVAGIDPRWMTAVLLLPDESLIEPIMSDIDEAVRDVGATVVGGHSEYVDQLERPLVSMTAMGVGEFIPTSGAQPGDVVILTKGAGIEGTAILAADFGDELAIDTEIQEEATTYLEELSVLPDSRAVREFATAMHDPTEGGVAAGLQELARASDTRIEVDTDSIPLRSPTKKLCRAADVDPIRIFGSGALLATVPEAELGDALEALDAMNIEAAKIGTVREGDPALVLDGTPLDEPVRDELYALWETADGST